MNTDALTKAIADALTDHGVGRDELHSWRCAYPTQFGLCSCFEELTADILSAVVRAVS